MYLEDISTEYNGMDLIYVATYGVGAHHKTTSIFWGPYVAGKQPAARVSAYQRGLRHFDTATNQSSVSCSLFLRLYFSTRVRAWTDGAVGLLDPRVRWSVFSKQKQVLSTEARYFHYQHLQEIRNKVQSLQVDCAGSYLHQISRDRNRVSP